MGIYDDWVAFRQCIIASSEHIDIAIERQLTGLGQLIRSYNQTTSSQAEREKIIALLKQLNISIYEDATIPNKEIIKKALMQFFNANFGENGVLYNYPSVSFANFPADVLDLALANVSPQDVANFIRAHPRFYRLSVNHTSLWRSFFGVYYPQHEFATSQSITAEAMRREYETQNRNVSHHTKRLFLLVVRHDIDGLKANAAYITNVSLGELDRDGKNYLTIAKEKKFAEIVTFILETLLSKANNQYLKLKYSVALNKFADNSPDFPNLTETEKELILFFKKIFLDSTQSISYSDLSFIINIVLKQDDYHTIDELIKIRGFDETKIVYMGYLNENKEFITWLRKFNSTVLIYAVKTFLANRTAVHYSSYPEYFGEAAIFVMRLCPEFIVSHPGFNDILRLVAMKGHFTVFKMLVDRAMALNVRIAQDILHCAVRIPNNGGVVEYLLVNRGRLQLDVNYRTRGEGSEKDKEALTPLCHAVATDSEYVAMLVQAGVVVVYPTQYMFVDGQYYTKNGERYEESFSEFKHPLEQIIENQQSESDLLKILNYFLQHFNIDIRNFKTKNGDSLLHGAISSTNRSLVLLLVNLGCDVNVRDAQGQTPLQLAVAITSRPFYLNLNDELDICRALIAAGADLTALFSKNLTLIAKIIFLHKELKYSPIKLITAHPRLDPKNPIIICSFIDMMHWTWGNHDSQNDGPEIVEAYVQLGMDVNAKRKDNCTPLYSVVSFPCNYSVDDVRLLLSHDADPHLPSIKGKSPFQLCTEKLNANPFSGRLAASRLASSFYEDSLKAFKAYKYFKAAMGTLMSPYVLKFFSHETFQISLNKAVVQDIELTKKLILKQLSSNQLSHEQKNQLVETAEKYIQDLTEIEEIKAFKQVGARSAVELKKQ